LLSYPYGEPAEMQLKLQQTLEDLAEKNLQISDLNATVKQKDAVISDLQAQLALRSCVKCPLARQALSKNNADLSSARGAISKLKSELAEANAATVNARGSAEALSKQVFKLSQTIEQLKRQAKLKESDSGFDIVGASPSKGTGLAGKKFGSISVAEESTSMDSKPIVFKSQRLLQVLRSRGEHLKCRTLKFFLDILTSFPDNLGFYNSTKFKIIKFIPLVSL